MKKIKSQIPIHYPTDLVVAGCDEAGRGCLAGPVSAAAVILPKDFFHPLLHDSKKLSAAKRELLRTYIENDALAYQVSFIQHDEIDQINIVQASFRAMHLSLDKLTIRPQKILIDGHIFVSYRSVPHQCVVKGDSKYCSIAAASILAKTYRDEWMQKLHEEYPQYMWNKNKGYPTKAHRKAIEQYGISPYHRLSYQLLPEESQMKLFSV